MIRGLLGRKKGMTQVFSPNGEVIPVTVIQVGPCIVTQVRTMDRDGYEAVQIGFEEVPNRKLTKPQTGHLASAYELFKQSEIASSLDVYLGQEGKSVRHLREFPVESIADHKIGDVIDINMFTPGQRIDVVGTSKGRGFAGVVKRHGFRGGPRTHGQSDRVRAPGSIGGGTTPGRVWKGQRMAGRMGNKRITIQNLEVVEVIADKHLILIRGSVPGPYNVLLQIKHAVKAGN
jgi:large subunit ribosomal protein L3